MTGTDRHALRVLSTLLRYPDESFRAELEDIGALVDSEGEHWHPELREAVNVFVREALRLRLCTLQELHVQVFETVPETSLYLTWHRYGDKPERGRALAALTELYADAGLEPVGGELPDNVPVVLEFMAEGPDWGRMIILDGFGGVMLRLAERLASTDTPYAPLGKAFGTVIASHLDTTPLPPQHGEAARPAHRRSAS